MILNRELQNFTIKEAKCRKLSKRLILFVERGTSLQYNLVFYTLLCVYLLCSHERTEILPLKMWMSILTVILVHDDDSYWKADCKYDKKVVIKIWASRNEPYLKELSKQKGSKGWELYWSLENAFWYWFLSISSYRLPIWH
jgi:hypothetical protein